MTSTDIKTESVAIQDIHPTYHYFGFPVEGDKHITICTLDKANMAQALIYARTLVRVGTHLPDHSDRARLDTHTTEGFIKPPKTVVKVTLPEPFSALATSLHLTLACNRTGVFPTYQPHITFDSQEQAELYMKTYPYVTLSRLSLINAKTKEESFATNCHPVEKYSWNEKYYQFWKNTFDWLF